MTSHIAWLWHSFVWERAEVLSMWWAVRLEAFDKVRGHSGTLPGPLWGGRQCWLHSSPVLPGDQIPFYPLLTDLLGTRLNSHHHCSVEGRAAVSADTSENSVSIFNPQRQLLAYSGTSLVLTLFVETPEDCDIVKVSLIHWRWKKIWYMEWLFWEL